MKYFFSLIMILNLASMAYASLDNCQKDCNAVPAEQKDTCLNQQDECNDQTLLNKVIFFEKNGIKKDVKFLLIKELNEKVEIFNKQIVQLQLRRAMYKKLIERSKQAVIVQE